MEGSAGQQGIFVDQLIVTGGKLRYSRATYMHEVTQMNWQAVAQQYRVINGIRMRFYRAGLGTSGLGADRSVEDRPGGGHDDRGDGERRPGQPAGPPGGPRRGTTSASGVADRGEPPLGRWQELIAFVGCPDLPSRRLQGDLEQAGQTYEWASTLAHLLEASPEVQVARAKAARARCALAREQVEPIPNLNVRARNAIQRRDERPAGIG